jgi:hypothetical protein
MANVMYNALNGSKSLEPGLFAIFYTPIMSGVTDMVTGIDTYFKNEEKIPAVY